MDHGFSLERDNDNKHRYNKHRHGRALISADFTGREMVSEKKKKVIKLSSEWFSILRRSLLGAVVMHAPV